MNDLKSLLSLTNKFYNTASVKTQSATITEKKQKQTKSTVVKKAVKSGLPELFTPDDLRKVTKVSPIEHPDMNSAPFDKVKTALWIKVSRVFSSKKKAG